MTRELYINDELVDLPESIIALSYAVNTLNELKTLNGNISNRITLPPTQRNKRILGFVGDLNVDLSNTIRRRQVCKYVQNGIEVIPEGIVTVGAITNKGIAVLVTSGNVDFFDEIDGSLQDLDLSEYDHVFGFDVIDSRLNRDGYIYPIVNYGDLTDASQYMNVSNMRPAVFLKTMVRKIVEQAGFTLINELETHPRTADQYSKMILPFALDDFQHSQRYIEQNDSYRMRAVQAPGRMFNAGTGKDGENDILIRFGETIEDPSSSFIAETYYTAKAKFIATIEVTFPELVFNGNTGSNRTRILRLMKKNQFDQKTVVQEIRLVAPSVQAEYRFNDVVLKAEGITLNALGGITDTFYVIFIDSVGSTLNVTIGKTATFTVTPVGGGIVFGETVQLEATVPDINKKDLLKAVSNIFGAVVQTDNQNKEVHIVPFFTIPENTDDYFDWTDRIVDPNDQSSETTIGSYAQSNPLLYKEDDGITPDDYASASLIIKDENLPLTKSLFELPFAASFDSFVLAGVKAMLIKKIANEGGNEFSINTEPRIGMVEFVDREVSFRNNGDESFTRVENTSIPQTYFEGAGESKGLMMGYLLSVYYLELTEVLNDQRKKSFKMLLRETDIAKLDFFKPVYLQQYNCYFYISKITDFSGVKPCTVELIKLY